jgi:hypothetical protein
MTLFCPSKFSWVRQTIYLNLKKIWARALRKDHSPVLGRRAVVGGYGIYEAVLPNTGIQPECKKH